MSAVAKPKQIVSVILLRPGEPRGFEVFLTRDRDKVDGQGETTIFPGGMVTTEDYSAAMLRRCSGMSLTAAHRIIGGRFAPREALGLWVAGIRVLFEEVGVFLGLNEAGEDPVMDPVRKVRLQARHAALRAGSLSFPSLLKMEELWADTARLTYFSYWQSTSPSGERLDLRFYFAILSPNQSPIPTLPRVLRGLWLSPDRALRLFEQSELPMAFSTFASLRTLADFDSVESLLKEYGSGARG